MCIVSKEIEFDNRFYKGHEVTDEILSYIYKLSQISNEYVVFHSISNKEQWNIINSKINKKMNDLTVLSNRYSDDLSKIKDDIKKLRSIFKNIDNSYQKMKDTNRVIDKNIEYEFIVDFTLSSNQLNNDYNDLLEKINNSRKNRINERWNSVIFIYLINILFMIFIFIWLRSVILSGIVALESGIEKMEEGDLSVKISEKGPKEFKKLSILFNNMANELSESIDELNKSKENIRITLNSIGDGVISSDIYGRVTHMNPVAERLTGWKIEDAKDKDIDKIFDIINEETREKIKSPYKAVMDTGKIVGLANHTVLKSKNNEEYNIADSGAPIYDKDMNIVGVVIVFRDVTEEYRMKGQVERKKRLEALGQLAGGVAHDFNNMLSGVIGAAEILKLKFDNDPSTEKIINIIIDSAQNGAELSKKLLSATRKQVTTLEKIRMNPIVKDCEFILKRTINKNISIELDLKAERDIVLGDVSNLQSALLNLGINARDAMPEGGKLIITTKNENIESLYSEKHPDFLVPGEHIVIEFRDTGIGIGKENIERIFEPFFTTKPIGHGTGVGLTSVFNCVRAHHGYIDVKSEIGKGSSFILYIPLTSEIKEEKNDEDKEKTYCLISGKSILIIDDEEVLRTTYKMILKEHGAKVYTADNGASGIEVFKEHKDEIDVVIVDWIMPVMGGEDCINNILKINPQMKIIISSGFTMDSKAENIYNKNKSHFEFIKKPFLIEKLCAKIESLLKK